MMGLGVRNWKSDLYFNHLGLVAVTVHFDAGCDAVSDGPTYRGYQPEWRVLLFSHCKHIEDEIERKN